MLLGLTALVFSAGIALPSQEVALEEASATNKFDVSAHIRAQLAQRTRMDQVQVAVSPIISDKLFSSYSDLEVSAALINRSLDKKHWLAQGAHFDPKNNQRLVQTVTEPFLQGRGIKEPLAVGVSSFHGSDKRRMQNIEATVSKFDGYIIKQGERFSFNEILGEVTEEEGFVWARVLRNSQNAWGLGGGVCQVSTNIFRAALNAGLTIDDRRAHSVIFDKYAPTGLDATIYLGIQDLQFTNNTPGDILMKFAMRDEKMVTVFYGTKDGRLVELEKTKHWEGYDGRTTTHWMRTVDLKETAPAKEMFISHYRPLVVEVAEE